MKHKLTRLTSLLLAFIMAFSMLLVPVQAAEFSDVQSNSWYSEAVDYVHEKGWMAGTSETTFAPDLEVTRGMIVTVLAKIAGADLTKYAEPAFTDTKAGVWYTNACAWAAAEGLVAGVGDGRFLPKQNITRQDLVTILYKFIQMQEWNIPADGDRTYNDMESVAAYALDAVNFCAASELVTGYSDGGFHPKDTATRAQLAVILKKMDVLAHGGTLPTDPMPAQSFDETADDVHVIVEAPEGALPAGTEMIITRIFDANTLNNIHEQIAGSVLGAVDISFWKDGVEIEPETDVNVSILMPEMTENGNYTVVHLDDEGNIDTINEIGKSDANGISFCANSFSVYAVIGDGEIGENARLNVVFKKGNQEIARLLVKESDTLSDIYDKILYDPGIGTLLDGQLFRGWTLEQNYTDKTTALDISQIRAAVKTYFEEHDVYEGEEYVVYGMLYNAFTITYKDGANLSISSDIVLVPVTQTSVSYTINQAYTAPDGEHHFEGWLVTDGAENVSAPAGVTPPYPNETVVTLTGSVVFSADAPAGNWIVYHENGGTYVAAEFIRAGNTTKRPTITMKRLGYTFDDWYADEACTTKFTFGTTIDQRTHVYAKWNKATTANYTVLIWKQNIAGDDYDFAESETIEGNVDDPITISHTDTSATVNSNTYEWTGFTFKSYNEGKTIAPEGNTIVNVYFDRITVTLKFYRFNATGYERNYDSSAQTGVEYFGRSGNSYSGYNYFRIYYYEGSWIYESYGSYYYYTGNRYIRSGNWEEITAYRTSGLYGSSLADNNYTWKTDYDWYDTSYPGGSAGGTRTTFLDAYLPTGGEDTLNFYGRDVAGSIPVRFHKQNADENGYTLTNTVYITANSNGESHFYISDKYNGFTAFEYSIAGGEKQSVGSKDNETGYYNSGEYVVFTNSLDIYFNRDKYKILFMDGAYVDGNDNPVENGPVVRSELKVVSNITYGASTASYNKDGDNYYDPSKFEDTKVDNYVFGGWYVDDGCTEPYTFTTMPEGITVYAKWVKAQYRIFLRPHVNTDDASLEWGNDDQAMNFRRSAGEEISLPTGTRESFELVGWFFDEDGNNPINAETFVCDDTTITADYDKTAKENMTDNAQMWTNPKTGKEENKPINKYGELEPNDNGINKDASRYWISHKLDLHAVWRAKITGALGISVIYDAGEGSNAPSDSLKYLDKAKAIAQGASTAPEGQRFLYWKVQKWDNAQKKFVDSGINVYPGDLFTVLKANAREQEITDGTQTADVYMVYSIQLVAVYGEAEGPEPSHIYWFANNGSNGIQHLNQHNDEDPVVAVEINLGYQIPTQENWAADTQGRDGAAPEGGLTYADHVFLGWARVIEKSGTLYKDDGKTALTDPINDLTEDDLFLKWVDETDEKAAHYETKNDAGNWVTVSQVACDEETPYHDLYAVWGSVYYIFHSSNGKLEAVRTPASKNTTVDLVNKVPEGFLYGGYYKKYGGFENREANAEQKALAVNATKMVSAVTTNTYDGSAVKVTVNGSSQRYWNLTEAYTAENQDADGKNVKPEAGTVYYVKEVPETFLNSKLVYVTDTNQNNKIIYVYLLTTVDDALYTSVGFKPKENALTYEESTTVPDTEYITGIVSSKVTITQSGSNPQTLEIRASDLGAPRGYVSMTPCHKLANVENFTMISQWQTLDGVNVQHDPYHYYAINNHQALKWEALSADANNELYVNMDIAINGEHWWMNDLNTLMQLKAYVYDSSTSNPTDHVWLNFKQVDGNIFSVTIPAGNWDKFIVCRCDKGKFKETNTFADGIFTQTNDITLDKNKNYVSFTCNDYWEDQDSYIGHAEVSSSWSTYTPNP